MRMMRVWMLKAAMAVVRARAMTMMLKLTRWAQQWPKPSRTLPRLRTERKLTPFHFM